MVGLQDSHGVAATLCAYHHSLPDYEISAWFLLLTKMVFYSIVLSEVHKRKQLCDTIYHVNGSNKPADTIKNYFLLLLLRSVH